MFEVFGIENTAAQLCAATARLSDREAADAVAAIYAGRGLIARICDAETRNVLEELEPTA